MNLFVVFLVVYVFFVCIFCPCISQTTTPHQHQQNNNNHINTNTNNTNKTTTGSDYKKTFYRLNHIFHWKCQEIKSKVLILLFVNCFLCFQPTDASSLLGPPDKWASILWIKFKIVRKETKIRLKKNWLM